ncbi:MAG: triose-phosphate isomerase [Nanoarchaeota archaeon]|nr:triose-phosphate isomerase [Nanoarchaeota archaeon]
MGILIINYKSYKEAVDDGLSIAEAAKEVSKELNVKIILSPPFTMLKDIARISPSIAQGMDLEEPGAHTGHVSWYEIKKSGAVGVLLNHSENRIASKDGKIDYEKLSSLIHLCLDHGLDAYVCVENIEEAEKVVSFNPTAIAYEPPELIGGNISVSTAKPSVVRDFCNTVKKASNSLALIGAGIKSGEDVRKSLSLGADGVLVASGIIKAKDFSAAIRELSLPLK